MEINKQYTHPLIDLLGTKLVYTERYPKNYSPPEQDSFQNEEFTRSLSNRFFHDKLFERRYG